MKVIIMNAPIVWALSRQCVGTKVVDSLEFTKALNAAVGKHDFTKGDVPGQAVIPLPKSAWHTVSCGVAKRSSLKPEDYIVREHRGEVELFAPRSTAERDIQAVVVVVDTVAAYLADPDVDNDPAEAARIEQMKATHVLVAVIAAAGPKPPVSSHRFVRNLAGGNNAYKAENGYTLEKAIEEAKKIAEYEKEWVTVAD